jgi:hypothetical protein
MQEATTSKLFSTQHPGGDWLLILILLGMLVAGCPVFNPDSFSMNIIWEENNDLAA